VDQSALKEVTDALGVPGVPLVIMRAEEASLVKNASNVFLALRLTFAKSPASQRISEWMSGLSWKASAMIPE
jgi:UDP-glucose 6-dehydrogenase